LLDRGRNDGDATSDESNTPNSTVLERIRKWILHYNVQHLHGPEEVAYDTDELVVLCLMRDRRAYVRSFVEHYLSLGVRHIFFLDNGSTDGSVEVAREYENVTVLRSDLPFKVYQVTMKQYLIERFARGRWSLCVDIDEFFDYPYSDIVSLSSFLSYLNEGSYTAVVTQMLDMFPEKPVSDNVEPGSSIADGKDEPIKELHKFYDVTNVRAYTYSRYRRICGRGNSLANNEIAVYKGGVVQTVFGFEPVLTKHALVFLDNRIRPMDGNVHKTSNASVADLSCVLFHYKFLDNLYEFVRQAVRQENYMRDSGKHKLLMKTLVQNRSLHLKGESSRELKNVNDLVHNRFLVVSREYMALVEDEERDSENPPSRDQPRKLVEAFFETRAEASAQTRKVDRLRQRVDKLQERAARDREKAKKSSARARRLQQQLQDIQASQSWRVFSTLGRIRTRVLGRGSKKD
jgi:hypothetical protein